MGLAQTFRFRSYSRKVDFERRAFAGTAVHANASLALRHNSVHRGEPETGPMPQAFCCEERFEDFRFDIVFHAATGVAFRQHYMFSGLRTRVLGNIMLVQFSTPCLDNDLASARHRIARVYGQIHKDLFNLARIGLDAANGYSWLEGERNVVTDHSLQ